jgi:hypothetical protein
MLLAVKYVSSIQQGRLIFPKVNVFHKRNHWELGSIALTDTFSSQKRTCEAHSTF